MKLIKKGCYLVKEVVKNPFLIKEGVRQVKKNGIRQLYSSIGMYATNGVQYEYENGNASKYKGDIKFSILMPVYNVETRWLDLAIESIKQQNYTNWELCIVDDCSTSVSVKDYLKNIKDKRIKIFFLEENKGISCATNKAAEISTGDFYLLMDNDDIIADDALDEFYQCLNKFDPDIIYSDQDIIDSNGNHREPLFKPDWSPDLFLSQMYIGHLLGFKKDLFIKIGGFRTEYNGSQDYDLVLRMMLHTNKIHHISKILYSWRDIPSSTAGNPESKPYAQIAGLNAIQSYLDLKYGKEIAKVVETENLFVYDVRYTIPENTKVSIIIPTKDNVGLLRTAIDSVEEKTSFENYEIIILNNNSVKIETYDYFEKVQKQYNNVSVKDALIEFNWSKLNNIGIGLNEADVYVFLNNDIEIISEEWLTRLTENALRKEIGTVGGLLLYEDGTIQHAGVVVGMGGWAEHVYKGMKPCHYGSPYISPMVTRNVTACTGACLAVSNSTLKQIGLFDERFIICGSDIEFSIRAAKRGFYNIYNPNIKLHHFESKSRDSYIPDVDFKMSYDVYTEYRKSGDPYYNNNLDYYSYNPVVKKCENEETEVTWVTAHDPKIKIAEINPYYFRYEERENKRLNLLVPSINPEHVFGGISTAIKFFECLSEKLGYDQRLILVDALPSNEGLKKFKDYTIVSPEKVSDEHKQIISYAYRDKSGIPVSKNDYFMLTAWWTAYCTEEAYLEYENKYSVKANPYIYFIQDYEPGFYAWSTKYMLADATYKMDRDIIAIFNSLQLKEFFDNNGYKFKYSYMFEPVLNEKLKQYIEENIGMIKKKKQILIYGRPSTERNAFSLIVASLNKWANEYKESSDWNIYSAGELHDDIKLDNGNIIHSLGKLSIEEYAHLLSESYAGISLMVSPHPSYPPLEMATFGIKTITNVFDNKNLEHFNQNVFSLNRVSIKTISDKLKEICVEYNEISNLNIDVNSNYIRNNNEFFFISEIEKLLK